MSTEGAGDTVLAETATPVGVESNIGHPSEPVVIAVAADGPASTVTISEGSAHLGGGGRFGLDAVLTRNGDLQERSVPVFTRADALWAVPLLDALARGVLTTTDDLGWAVVVRRAPVGELDAAHEPRVLSRRTTRHRARRRPGGSVVSATVISPWQAASVDLPCATVDDQLAAFADVVVRNPVVARVLDRLPDLEVPDAWLAAGCLFQTVWNVLSDRAPTAGILTTT